MMNAYELRVALHCANAEIIRLHRDLTISTSQLSCLQGQTVATTKALQEKLEASHLENERCVKLQHLLLVELDGLREKLARAKRPTPTDPRDPRTPNDAVTNSSSKDHPYPREPEKLVMEEEGDMTVMTPSRVSTEFVGGHTEPVHRFPVGDDKRSERSSRVSTEFVWADKSVLQPRHLVRNGRYNHGETSPPPLAPTGSVSTEFVLGGHITAVSPERRETIPKRKWR